MSQRVFKLYSMIRQAVTSEYVNTSPEEFEKDLFLILHRYVHGDWMQGGFDISLWQNTSLENEGTALDAVSVNVKKQLKSHIDARYIDNIFDVVGMTVDIHAATIFCAGAVLPPARFFDFLLLTGRSNNILASLELITTEALHEELSAVQDQHPADDDLDWKLMMSMKSLGQSFPEKCVGILQRVLVYLRKHTQ